MKLLYSAFDPVPWPKGSGTRIEATVRAFAKAGAQVHLHTPIAPKSLDEFASRLEIPNLTHCPVEIREENFLERVMAFRQSVRHLLEEQSFDAAVFRSPWEGLPIVQRVPRPVYEAHGFPSVELSSHYPGVEREPHILDRLIAEENLCLARSRLYVTPSLTNRHFLMRRGARPDRIRLLPNSVEVAELPPVGTPPPAAPPYRIGYMGTLAPWQGLGTLLEAVAMLRDRTPCRVVVAGTRKGRWIRPIRELAARLGLKKCLEFHGPLPKSRLFELLQGCHLLAAPLPNDPRNGLQGCCPVKILEYMGCGRPIVSTRIGPVKEILSDQETAVLVPPGSASALASGIASILRQPPLAEALAQRALEVVLAQYPRSRFDQQIHDLWHEIRMMPIAPPAARGTLPPPFPERDG